MKNNNMQQSQQISILLKEISKNNVSPNLEHKEISTFQRDDIYREFRDEIINKYYPKAEDAFPDKSSFFEFLIFWIIIDFVPKIKQKILNDDLKLRFGNKKDHGQPDFVINDEVFEITGFFLGELKFQENIEKYEKSLSSGIDNDGKWVMILDDIFNKISDDFRKQVKKKMSKKYVNNEIVNLILYHGRIVDSGIYDGTLFLWNLLIKNCEFMKRVLVVINKIYIITYSQITDTQYKIIDNLGNENLRKFPVEHYRDYIIEIDINTMPKGNEDYALWKNRVITYKK